METTVVIHGSALTSPASARDVDVIYVGDRAAAARTARGWAVDHGCGHLPLDLHESRLPAIRVPMPRGVYTEWGGGTPAFVRELGEPLSSISPAEYGALEAELLSIERDRGWRIHDELQLYRRPDGGVFVADVGQWQAPVASAKPWSRLDSSLHHLLQEVQQKYLPGLATRDPGRNPPSERYAYTLRVPVPTLPLLADDASRVAEALAELRKEGDARYAGKYGGHQRRDDAQVAEEYLDELASRDAFGVPTPDDVRAFAPVARELLDGSGARSAAKKNGRRRPARRR